MSELIPEGSRVRLLGLKNPSFNGQKGVISGYSKGGERVIIALDDPSSEGLVKVKPKQIEVIEKAPSRRNSLRTGASSRSTRRNSTQSNCSSIDHNTSYASKMRRLSSSDNLSQSSDIAEVFKDADKMLEIADTSGDGLISEEEFDCYMTRNTNHPLGLIRDAFRSIDTDGNGVISSEEIRRAFLKRRKLHNNVSSVDDLLECAKDADSLFRKADTSGDGYVSTNEFEFYMKRHTTHSELTILELFEKFDINNDGFISHDEVHKVFLQQKLEKDKLERGEEAGPTSGKLNMADILGVKDDALHELADDVYNMLFLSKIGGQAFWYAIFIFGIKSALFVIVAIDLYRNKGFPDFDDVSLLLRSTQFLLLPMSVAIEEELINTYFIYSNLEWSAAVLELAPYAYRWKYHAANMARLVDGLLFLFVNTTLMMQATDILGMLSNLTALQFLQEVDNLALHLARYGYLTDQLEETAGDVLRIKLPRNKNSCLHILDSILLFATFLVLVVSWVVCHYVL